MTRTVVDANIVVYATFGHGLPHFADSILDNERPLLAPRTLPLEFAGFITKQVRRGRITPEEGRVVWSEYVRRGIEIVQPPELESRALELALDTELHAVDATYLLTALDFRAALATNDVRLLRAAAMVGVDVWAPSAVESGTLEP